MPERLSDYVPGKFHPVHLGDVLNARYHVFRKLGSGGQATVWLARDKSVPERRFVAIKVFGEKSSESEMRLEELLGRLSPALSHPGSQHVELALDSFMVHGPNGHHFCKVLEPLGPSLIDVLEDAFDERAKLNEPESWLGRVLEGDIWSGKAAKRACWQILLGLDYLHSQRIAHRDLQPANVCLALDYNLSSLSENEIQKAVWPADPKAEDPLPEPASPHDDESSSDDSESSSDDSAMKSWIIEHEERQKLEAAQWKAFEADPGDALADPHSAAWNKANFLNSRSSIRDLLQGQKGMPLKPGELRYIVAQSPLDNIHPDFHNTETPPRLVLIDLGFARVFDECETHPLRNLADFQPPEDLLGIPATHKADIFSAGLLFWEIVMLRRLVEPRLSPWDDSGKIDQKNRQLRDLALRLGPMPATLRDAWRDADRYVDAAGNALDMTEEDEQEEEYGPDDFEYGDIWHHAGRRRPLDMDEKEMRVFVYLMQDMMRWDPRERPSTSELLQHEWFKEFQ
ncbi:kinase-like domain-containing protein [Podospora appendiculata]|uniref:non-specific serine/threonine protein kinase n=1 Tax=Podospora appendiculata TaxID=314037 RepID=A0AAE0XBE9_9PEZI|nr:kinase-like domain-containing protein [Podospora appendiculata]